MSGLNIKKLREMQKSINSKAGDGGDLFLYSNKLPEELDVRILPPPEEANGVYFLEQEQHWVNGKPYLSNSTPILGGSDVIQEEIDKAHDLAKSDKTLEALLKAKKNNIPVLKKETRYLIPILVLDCEYDKDTEELLSMAVQDDKPKILVAKPTLLKNINKVVTSRPFQNQTEYGIADRVKGYNLIIGREGKGLDTSYTAMGWNEAMEMDEKYYEEKMLKGVNVFELTRKGAKSDAYLRSVIRNYLYGEDILEDETSTDTKADTDAPAEEKKQPTKSARPSRKTTAPAKENAKAEKQTGSRSLLDDAASSIDDLD